ncbi:MAG: hypothetical protein ACKO3B_06475 [Bacteroidota bacterium]
MIARLVLLVTVVVFTEGCSTHAPKQASGEPCIRVRYVTGICLDAVLEIRDPAFYHLGERWREHDHVFRTTVPCGSEELMESGRDFYVVLMSKPSDEPPCIRCRAALDYDGEKSYPVKLVKRCPSD